MDKLSEILDKVDFVALVSKKTNLKRRGDKMVGLSPFSNEKTPSFFVNPTTKTWYCFSTSEGGGVLNYVSKIENLSKEESVRFLADYVGVDLEDGVDAQSRFKKTLRLAHSFYRRNTQPAIEYLQQRQLSSGVIEDYGIGYSNGGDAVLSYLYSQGITEEEVVSSGIGYKQESGQVTHRFRNRVMLPIFDEYGTLVSFTGRDVTGESTTKYMHGPSTTLFNKRKVVWGLKNARKLMSDVGYVVVCEGQIDAMSLVDVGIPAVAILGSSMSEDQLTLISKLSQNVYLTFDNDTAGNRALSKSFTMMRKLGLDSIVYGVMLPKGYDPDQFISEYGVEEFHKLREDATSDTSVFVKSLIRENYKSGVGKTSMAKKVLGALKDSLHQSYTYRSMDLIERVAQEFSLNPKELRDWMSRGPTLRGPLNERIEGMSFPAPIYERRILYAVLTDPSLVAKVDVPFGDFSSLVVNKTLSAIEPTCPPTEIFDILREKLSEDEYHLVLQFYSTGLPTGDFETSLEIMKAKINEREKRSMVGFLGRPLKGEEITLKRVVRDILDYNKESR
jgi:DNA primase